MLLALASNQKHIFSSKTQLTSHLLQLRAAAIKIGLAEKVSCPMLKATDMNKLKVQQNNSIRIMFNLDRRTNLSTFYKKVKILRLQDQVQLSLLKVSYRYFIDRLPIRITNLFNLQNHNYNTRNRNNLRVQHHTTSQYNKSYLGQAPGLWLHLPAQLKDKNSIRAFIKAVSKFKIINYR